MPIFQSPDSFGGTPSPYCLCDPFINKSANIDIAPLLMILRPLEQEWDFFFKSLKEGLSKEKKNQCLEGKTNSQFQPVIS